MLRSELAQHRSPGRATAATRAQETISHWLCVSLGSTSKLQVKVQVAAINRKLRKRSQRRRCIGAELV